MNAFHLSWMIDTLNSFEQHFNYYFGPDSFSFRYEMVASLISISYQLPLFLLEHLKIFLTFLGS